MTGLFFRGLPLIRRCCSQRCDSFSSTTLKQRPLRSPTNKSFSSNANQETEKVIAGRLAFSKSSLGLENRFVRPVLASIRQLPEIDTFWNTSTPQKFAEPSTIDALHRASDVFASFAKGGPEYIATQALLAECQQRLALFDDALETLNVLDPYVQQSTIQYGSDDITLAKAKVYWTKGDFSQSQSLCESIIQEYDDFNEHFPSTNLHMASAMTGKALSQLSSMKELDDAFSVRDYFRITIKFLERNPPMDNILPKVVADLNYGIAEAYYGIFLEELNDVEVPMDPALKSWFQGLQKTKESKNKNNQKAALEPPNLRAASNMLKASLQSNLSWGVLNYEQDRSDRLKKASGYAKDALAIYDADAADGEGNCILPGKEGMCRTLSVIASCYQQAGSAVTAEGLFQSAIDKNRKLPAGPLPLLELRDACTWYADLCRQWDKREKDAKKLEIRVAEIDNSLDEAWKGKPGILAGSWFWTPGDFQ